MPPDILLTTSNARTGIAMIHGYIADHIPPE